MADGDRQEQTPPRFCLHRSFSLRPNHNLCSPEAQDCSEIFIRGPTDNLHVPGGCCLDSVVKMQL